jgi:hypothetical protein
VPIGYGLAKVYLWPGVTVLDLTLSRARASTLNANLWGWTGPSSNPPITSYRSNTEDNIRILFYYIYIYIYIFY